MRPARLLLVLLLAGGAAPLAAGLAGCATFDTVEGVPDALDWSYFEGSPAEVASATRRVLTAQGYTIDAVDQTSGVYLIRVTTSTPSVDFSEIRIEPAATGAYRARAQTSPRGNRLGLDLERAISAEL